MDALELLDKRRHIVEYSKEIPDKELIEKILWKSWKVTPSKNNFMPYHVNVYGPDQQEARNEIWKLQSWNKKNINDTNIPRIKTTPGVIDNDLTEWNDSGKNPFFNHSKSASYLVVYTQRICQPNKLYEKNIRKGDYFEQMHLSEMETIIRGVSIEVGMFAAHLSAFATEVGLDTSTVLCYPAQVEKWHTVPGVEYPVLLIQSIGKCKISKQDHQKKHQPWDAENDIKPEPETVIRWI